MIGRFLLLLLILLGALGCTIQPRSTGEDPSLALFVQILEGPKAHRAQILSHLESEYPQSPWTLRARQVHELQVARDALEQRLREIEKEKARQAQETRALRMEAERLRDDLGKLKQIIIDIEKRATLP